MATSDQVAEVRKNTDERTDDEWSDSAISTLIDASDGVNAASAAVWRSKAAIYSSLVDVAEAGASHKFSDLHRNALEMAKTFQALSAAAGEGSSVSSTGHAKVKVIDRAYADE